MKNRSGKILSIVFLFHLLFIQVVNLASARHQLTSSIDSQKHFSAPQTQSGTVTILCEADEMEEEDDEKPTARITRIHPTNYYNPGFFANLVHLFPASINIIPVALSRPAVFSAQGLSLQKIHCCFLI